MTSHQLAHELLALPCRTVVQVTYHESGEFKEADEIVGASEQTMPDGDVCIVMELYTPEEKREGVHNA